MQTQFTQRNIATTPKTWRSHQPPTCRQLAEIRTNRRPVRVSFPVPRRESCLTRRAMRAALRESEFHDWLNGGDDFVGTMHQPVA
jgi:hypothetical protein